MGRDPRAQGTVGAGNVPGNPLRHYRLSMLSHGFVDHDDTDDFAMDETEAMTYSVMRPHGRTPPWAYAIAAVILVVAVMVMIVVSL